MVKPTRFFGKIVKKKLRCWTISSKILDDFQLSDFIEKKELKMDEIFFYCNGCRWKISEKGSMQAALAKKAGVWAGLASRISTIFAEENIYEKLQP